MLDADTFLTELYVMVDDFCKTLPPHRAPGREASLSRSEVVTLALFSQFYKFKGERDFYRYAQTQLTEAFPRLPDRSQFNRLVRASHDVIVGFFLHVTRLLKARAAAYEALDATGVL